jgi:hypothetical protein
MKDGEEEEEGIGRQKLRAKKTVISVKLILVKYLDFSWYFST